MPCHKLLLIACLMAGVMYPALGLAEVRMTVEGNILEFDTDAISGEGEVDKTISASDPRTFGELVMDYPSVDTVVVAGAGGVTWAAYEIAAKIKDFNLNTVARNNCSSACAIIFMAGRERRLQNGARLGFNRVTRSAKDQREYYQENKDDYGWVDEFAFANSAFESGQVAAREFITYAVEQGVSLEFALRVLTYSGIDMWYPTPEELEEAGVLVGPQRP